MALRQWQWHDVFQFILKQKYRNNPKQISRVIAALVAELKHKFSSTDELIAAGLAVIFADSLSEARREFAGFYKFIQDDVKKRNKERAIDGAIYYGLMDGRRWEASEETLCSVAEDVIKSGRSLRKIGGCVFHLKGRDLYWWMTRERHNSACWIAPTLICKCPCFRTFRRASMRVECKYHGKRLVTPQDSLFKHLVNLIDNPVASWPRVNGMSKQLLLCSLIESGMVQIGRVVRCDAPGCSGTMGPDDVCDCNRNHRFSKTNTSVWVWLPGERAMRSCRRCKNCKRRIFHHRGPCPACEDEDNWSQKDSHLWVKTKGTTLDAVQELEASPDVFDLQSFVFFTPAELQSWTDFWDNYDPRRDVFDEIEDNPGLQSALQKVVFYRNRWGE